MNKRLALLIIPVLGILALISSLSFPYIGAASAFQLQVRSLAISSPTPSANTTHTFTFTFPDNSIVGSLEFQYCTSPLFSLPCDAPAGLNASGAVLQNQSGEVGFTIATESTNNILLTRTPSLTSSDTSQYVFTGVVNPSFTGTFFARISTYPTVDGSGAYTDYGGVVSSTATSIALNTYVPPILEFCVGQTVAYNCSSTSGNFLDFGNFSTSSTSSSTSQMAVGTNAQAGVAITASGTSLTSGNNVIATSTSPTASKIGTNQFGINLKSNSVPSVGSNPSGLGVVTPTPNYNLANKYTYNDGDTVASAPTATDFTTLTVSYIVNVASTQPSGVYNTDITYICTGVF